ncbi:MAG: DUF3054 domain-containing protein [Cryobacterium sp.]
MTNPGAQARITPTRMSGYAGAADAVLVLAFVLIGRASHGEGLWAALETYWPFLLGLAVGWALLRAWRNPLTVLSGLGIWASTVVVGLGLRAITGQGTQLSFMIVTAVVLGVFLLGWRALYALARRRAVQRMPAAR